MSSLCSNRPIAIEKDQQSRCDGDNVSTVRVGCITKATECGYWHRMWCR
jgi:hypothetical protein